LNDQECDYIMAAILQYCLPKLGVCCSLPRSLVFVSDDRLGLGIQHLFTLQEVVQLRDIVSHVYECTLTGQLNRTSFEIFLLEIGLDFNYSRITEPLIQLLTMNCLTKSSILFLKRYGITLTLNADPRLQREQDNSLMNLLLYSGATVSEMWACNKCRLALHVFFLSDMASGDGKNIEEWAWSGTTKRNIPRHKSWPVTTSPSRSDWETWRHTL